jgi:hypothetical protein
VQILNREVSLELPRILHTQHPFGHGLLARGVCLLLGIWALLLLLYRSFARRSKSAHQQQSAVRGHDGISKIIFSGDGSAESGAVGSECNSRAGLDAPLRAAADARAAAERAATLLAEQLQQREGELVAVLSKSTHLEAQLYEAGSALLARGSAFEEAATAAAIQAEQASNMLQMNVRKLQLLQAVVLALRDKLMLEEDTGKALRGTRHGIVVWHWVLLEQITAQPDETAYPCRGCLGLA